MRTFLLNKLVRDGIVPSMMALGQEVVHSKLRGAERLQATGKKVLEETLEIDPAKPVITELLDNAEAAGRPQAGRY